MGAVGDLVLQALRLATGVDGGFHLWVWLLSTLVLAGVGAGLAALGRSIVDPIAVLVALKPGRVVSWMFITAIGAPIVFIFLALTLLLAPLSVVLLVLSPLAVGIGVVAMGTVYGDRLGRRIGQEWAPPLAAAMGVVVLRLPRLLPWVGATLESFVCWFALAATVAVLWDLAVSWYRRRMDDDEQFDNSQLIEWDERGPRPPGAS